MPADKFDEILYPKISIGSKVIVWCLEFPPERRGNEIWTRLLEEVEIEIIKIEQQDPSSETYIIGRDASGREFYTSIAMQFAEKNRMNPGFLVPASIKRGGGSPEWWTPELFRRNGWHLIVDA